MSKEIKRVTKIDNKTFLFETYEKPLREQIQQLKQQLEEKDKEINQLKQEKKNAGEEKARAYLDTLTKPKIIDLCLQYINDKNIAEQQLEALMLEISKQEVERHDLPDYCTRTGTDYTNLGKIEELQRQLAEKDIRIEELEGQFAYECECNMQLVDLQKQLAEKDKEINSLIIDYEKRISQEQELMSSLEKQLAEKEEELLKQKEKSARTEQIYSGIIVDKDKEIEKLKQQYTLLENENGKLAKELIVKNYKKAQKEVSFGKQLAIQELEKVKILIQNAINFVRPNFVEVYDAINKQIKELKGEKDDRT